MRVVALGFVTAGAVVISTAAHAQYTPSSNGGAPLPAKVEAERCGNAAAAFFTRQKKLESEQGTPWLLPGQPGATWNYENNQSVPVKGCFILIANRVSGDPIIAYELFDVNRHRELGTCVTWSKTELYSVYKCKVNDLELRSVEEWRSKITPYVPPPSQ